METSGNRIILSFTQISHGHISVQVRVRSGYEIKVGDGVGGKEGEGGGSGGRLLFD